MKVYPEFKDDLKRIKTEKVVGVVICGVGVGLFAWDLFDKLKTVGSSANIPTFTTKFTLGLVTGGGIQLIYIYAVARPRVKKLIKKYNTAAITK